MDEKSLINDVLFYAFILIGILILVFAHGCNKKGETNAKKIVGVHVKGEVNAPGYYELDYESRVKDAIVIAGGEKETANLSEINLARILCDGEEIIVPSFNNPTAVSEIELVNLNTADLYHLCKLEGIGESIASDIIDYRTKNGPFERIEELMNVEGIGEEKYNKIKGKITV